MAPIPTPIRKRAVAAYRKGGRSLVEVAHRFKISAPALSGWLRRVRETGSVEPAPHGGGWHPILGPAAQARLKELAGARPHATKRELRDALGTELGRHISAATVSRELKHLGIRRVRVAPTAVAAAVPRPRRYGYTARHRWTGGAHAYPSSLTDAEWELVADMFEKHGRGRPETYSRRQLVDAISYVMRSGCSWRMLPKDFPPWQNVYATFRRWTAKGLFERMHDRLRARWREREKRHASPTAGVIDSQSVKTSEKGGPKVTMEPRRSRDASATS